MGDVVPFPVSHALEFEGLALWKATWMSAVLSGRALVQAYPHETQPLIRLCEHIDDALDALHDLHPHISPMMTEFDEMVFEVDNDLSNLRTSLFVQLRRGTFYINDVDVSVLELSA